MTEKERVLSILDKYKLKAKKSFGQNFLINDGIIKRIIKIRMVCSLDGLALTMVMMQHSMIVTDVNVVNTSVRCILVAYVMNVIPQYSSAKQT